MKAMITKLSWGSIDVRVGKEEHTFRDCKVWPEGAEPWEWEKTDTHHNPGIQPADIKDILLKDVDVIVLSRGRMLRLQICPETIALLKASGVKYYFEETSKAVAIFNRLVAKDRKVGGLFHTTC